MQTSSHANCLILTYQACWWGLESGMSGILRQITKPETKITYSWLYLPTCHFSLAPCALPPRQLLLVVGSSAQVPVFWVRFHNRVLSPITLPKVSRHTWVRPFLGSLFACSMCCRFAFLLVLSLFFYFLPVPLSFCFSTSFSIHPPSGLRTYFSISLQYSVFHLSIHVLWTIAVQTDTLYTPELVSV